MKKIIQLLILVHLCACSSSKSGEDIEYTMELKESKKITLPIDENTYYLSKSIFQFEESGKEYLQFGNFEKRQHEILIYDLEGQNLYKRIPLEKEGPNGVPAVYGCIPYYDSKTFLVSQHNRGMTTIIDGEGNVHAKYNMRQSADSIERRGFWVDCRYGLSFFYTPSFTKDSIVYFKNELFIQ